MPSARFDVHFAPSKRVLSSSANRIMPRQFSGEFEVLVCETYPAQPDPEMLMKRNVLSPRRESHDILSKFQGIENRPLQRLSSAIIGTKTGKKPGGPKMKVQPEMLMKTKDRKIEAVEQPEMFMKTKGF